jgi:hypothetical protein
MDALILTKYAKLNTRYSPTDLVDAINFDYDDPKLGLRKLELEESDVFVLDEWSNDEEGWQPATVWTPDYPKPISGMLRMNNSLIVIEVDA